MDLIEQSSLARERVTGIQGSDFSRESSSKAKAQVENAEFLSAKGDGEEERSIGFYEKYRPFMLAGLALLILGWWISATILKTTRHRWFVCSR